MNPVKRLTPADLVARERLSSLRPETPATDESEMVFNYSPTTNSTKKKKKSTSRKIAKFSATPLVGILLLIFLVISIISFVSSPVTTLARLAMDAFDTQSVTTDARTNQLLSYKVNSNPDEPVKYQILADYRQITPKLDESLKEEGIVVDQTNHTVKFKQKNISGDQLIAQLNSDFALKSATDGATAMRRLVYQDKPWQQYKNRFNLTQTGFKIGEDLATQELDFTKSSSATYRFNTSAPESDTISSFNSITQNLALMNQNADTLEKNKETPSGKSFTNLATIDQSADTCSLFQTINSVQTYQKTDQADQLSKLASLILTEADKIKAGESDTSTVNYLNNRLTQTSSYTDSQGNMVQNRNAMDSYAQRYLSTGFSGAPDASAQKYVMGANQPLAQTKTELINSGQTNDCQKTGLAGFFSNIWNFFTGKKPSANSTHYLTTEVKQNTTATNLSAMTGLATAPDLSGEDLANAFAVGVAQITAQNAQAHGLAVLTEDQAVAYLQSQQTLIAQRAEQDRRNLSPFDTNSPYTFLGSIVHQLNLSRYQSDLPSSLTSFLTLARQTTFKSKSVLASNDQIRANLQFCYDNEYRQAHPDIALTPYCSVVYGTPIETLDLDIEEYINRLVNTGNLEIIEGSCDVNGNYCGLRTSGELKEYEQNCLNRSTPIGNEGTRADAGQSCVADSEIKKLFPVYFSDLYINNNLKQQIYQPNTAKGLWPVPGHNTISSPFGPRMDPISGQASFHDAIDIAAPTGAQVVATESGTIKLAGVGDSYGALAVIVVSDDEQDEFQYWHLSKIDVVVGQKVEAGQKIGEIGSTGYSTGPHLHFVTKINGSAIDPMLYLSTN